MPIRFVAILTLILSVMSTASASSAAPFAPAVMRLDIPDIIAYDFTGEPLDIPVTVTGTPAQVVLTIYTSGRGQEIGAVTNGYLGWHYVNKVDTCLYASTSYSFSTGPHTIRWDGRDQDGGFVLPGDYTYYVWGVDTTSQKQLMSSTLFSGWGFEFMSDILETDEQGLPLANPIWYANHTGNLERWVLGGDPNDKSLLQLSAIEIPDNWSIRGDPLIDPRNHNRFYLSLGNLSDYLGGIGAYLWNPDGTASLDAGFGAGGYAETFPMCDGKSFNFTVLGDRRSFGVVSDGAYLFTGDANHVTSNDPDADFYIYDFNGALIDRVDLTPWWSSRSDFKAGAQMNGGPSIADTRNGRVFLGSHATCLNQMVSPARYLESGNAADFFVWTNGNGDYMLDKHFEETASLKWVCNDFNMSPYKYSYNGDDLLFSVCGFYDDTRELSFGLLGPDGTGLGYFAFAGQTNGWNKGISILDGGTPFDGLYTDNEQTGGPHWDYSSDKSQKGIFFVANDSRSGTIISSTGSFVALLSPNGGEQFVPGTRATIRWTSTDVTSLTIAYSPDAGSTWFEVAANIPASAGEYQWTLPEISSGRCLVRIADSANPVMQDISNETFLISRPFVRVDAPNGGEMSPYGKYRFFLWSAIGVKAVNIEFSIDGGTTWMMVAEQVNAGNGNVRWMLPRIASETCLMRVTDALGSGLTDTSDGYFTTYLQKLKILEPNGGEELTYNQNVKITWESEGIKYVTFSFSVDNGATWNTIRKHIPAENTSYTWNPYPVQSTLYLIRITDDEDPTIFDESDAPFTFLTVSVDKAAPETFGVDQNSPNPFNPSTAITFSIPSRELVEIGVFNLSGQRVATLADDIMDAGRHTLTWDASGCSAGVYLCRVKAGANERTIKMLLMK